MTPKQELENIRQTRAKFWQPGFGTITEYDALYLLEGIKKCKPKNVLELGTASGISTGLIASFLHDNDGDKLTTIDYSETFWVDKTKPTGYLASEIYKKNRVDIKFIRGQYSAYLHDISYQDEFDLVFIDANHQHPWPTLDMICLLPFIKSGARVYHHDLSLYKLQQPILGIGPKFLFDQVAAFDRHVAKDKDENTYYFVNPQNFRDLEKCLIDALYLPWTTKQRISEKVITHIADIAKKHWSSNLSKEILNTYSKFK